MIALDVSKSPVCKIFLAKMEYSAQVSAAAGRDWLLQNREGENSALRGSMTATTPSAAIPSTRRVASNTDG
jgi:hypothetical protein